MNGDEAGDDNPDWLLIVTSADTQNGAGKRGTNSRERMQRRTRRPPRVIPDWRGGL